MVSVQDWLNILKRSVKDRNGDNRSLNNFIEMSKHALEAMAGMIWLNEIKKGGN